MKKINSKRKLITLFWMCLFVIVTLGISAPAMAAFPSWASGSYLLAGLPMHAKPLSIPVTIDGNISYTEWSDALGGYNFRFFDDDYPSQFVDGRIFLKHDGTDLYILLLIDKVLYTDNVVFIYFDSVLSLCYSAGDDWIEWYEVAGSGQFIDLYDLGTGLLQIDNFQTLT